MKKLVPFYIPKMWGYELRVHSPLANGSTKTEDGNPTTEGLVVTILKADDRLSVQVHPDDEMARRYENSPLGKDESWYVIETYSPDASMVLGLKNYDKEFIKKALAEGTFESNLVVKKVKPGEFYNILAGQVHGIGAHIKLIEVATPFDKTYRYFDYDRLENGQKRELHVEKALASQREKSWRLEPTSKDPLTYRNSYSEQIFTTKPHKVEKDAIVVDLVNDVGYLAKAGETVSPSKHFAVITDLRK